MQEGSPEEEEEDRNYEGDQMGAVERRCVAGGEGLLGFLGVKCKWGGLFPVALDFLLFPFCFL